MGLLFTLCLKSSTSVQVYMLIWMSRLELNTYCQACHHNQVHEICPTTSLTLCSVGLVRRQAILIQFRHLKKHRISLLRLSGNAYKAIFARNLGLSMGSCSDNCLNITCHCVAKALLHRGTCR